ncbi:hypothetical protein IH86_13495 [Sphingobium yanoikuyae]|nr:hypothetical protein IH86_13495 [Sphingobium yanoikuyae]OJY54350.1 MAG: hypothetical protein BGP17_15725 [Sphingomonas sp. 67-41]PHP16546.1 hypothetical protein CG471_27545 [Sphingobium sp. IP1]
MKSGFPHFLQKIPDDIADLHQRTRFQDAEAAAHLVSGVVVQRQEQIFSYEFPLISIGDPTEADTGFMGLFRPRDGTFEQPLIVPDQRDILLLTATHDHVGRNHQCRTVNPPRCFGTFQNRTHAQPR